jgi:HPt (histidine-containing phosphotransfer) domain-containing protein
MIRELEMDAATVIDLCQSFLERGEQYLRDLRAAAEPRDDATLDRVAHGFKGMAGNLRFRRMTELSDRLRKAAQARSDDPAPLIRDLAAEFDALRKVLEERWLKSGSADAGKSA